uniref:hypothetical protein n=1 Tax=Acinetobacter baumannii TaxID=470 RepID=UPI001D1781FE
RLMFIRDRNMNQEKQPLFIIKNDFEVIILILIGLLVGYGLIELCNKIDNLLLIIVVPCLVLAEFLWIGLILSSRDRSSSKEHEDDKQSN